MHDTASPARGRGAPQPAFLAALFAAFLTPAFFATPFFATASSATASFETAFFAATLGAGWAAAAALTASPTPRNDKARRRFLRLGRADQGKGDEETRYGDGAAMTRRGGHGLSGG